MSKSKVIMMPPLYITARPPQKAPAKKSTQSGKTTQAAKALKPMPKKFTGNPRLGVGKLWTHPLNYIGNTNATGDATKAGKSIEVEGP